jgi:transporter family protein
VPQIFIKKGSASIHPILGGVILQFVAALLGTILLGSLMLGADKSFELHYDRNGLAWSVAAGLAVGLAEMLSFCVSGLGVPATQSIPIIIGGSVMFGAVLGLIVLGEKLMLQGWSGIALLVIGVVFVALDPGEKVEEGGGGSSGEAVEGTPPAYWVAIALICASAYAFYNIFIKKGSASMNPILGGKNAHAIDWFMKARCLLILVSIHPCG